MRNQEQLITRRIVGNGRHVGRPMAQPSFQLPLTVEVSAPINIAPINIDVINRPKDRGKLRDLDVIYTNRSRYDLAKAR